MEAGLGTEGGREGGREGWGSASSLAVRERRVAVSNRHLLQPVLSSSRSVVALCRRRPRNRAQSGGRAIQLFNFLASDGSKCYLLLLACARPVLRQRVAMR